MSLKILWSIFFEKDRFHLKIEDVEKKLRHENDEDFCFANSETSSQSSCNKWQL